MLQWFVGDRVLLGVRHARCDAWYGVLRCFRSGDMGALCRCRSVDIEVMEGETMSYLLNGILYVTLWMLALTPIVCFLWVFCALMRSVLNDIVFELSSWWRTR